MANEIENADAWADADVLIAPIGSTIPANVNTAFNSDWKFIGLLDGDQGFTHNRAEDATDKFAWGGILMRRTRKNYKETVSMTAFEYNATVRALVFPGSTAGVRKVPRPEPVMVALEKRDGDDVRRLITSNYAEFDPTGENKDNEGDVTAYPLMASVFPTSDGDLWIEQPAFGGPTLMSLAITGDNTMAIGDINSLVATATYSDASTADVTAAALWSSATPAKVTVPYGSGFVVGIANGTSVITARFGSVSDTETVTVS